MVIPALSVAIKWFRNTSGFICVSFHWRLSRFVSELPIGRSDSNSERKQNMTHTEYTKLMM